MRKYEDLGKEFDEVFTPKKKYSLKYARVLERIGETKRAGRVKDCGTYFEVGLFDDGSARLKRANFCKDPLCPQCAKRKSLKLFGQVSACVSRLKTEYKFVFVTLTVKNCSGAGLRQSCDLLQSAYIRLMDRKRMSFVKGAFRALEITHDNNKYITRDMYNGNKAKHLKPRKKYYDNLGLVIGDENPNFDMFHPHLHIIFAVPANYFESSEYLRQSELAELWAESVGQGYTPMVDIRACTDYDSSISEVVKFNSLEDFRVKNLSSAVAEIAKYSVKGSDFLSGTDDQNEKTVKSLLGALKNRKMFEFYGVFRAVRKELKLEADIENGDLVHVESDSNGKSKLLVVLIFEWNDKLSRYIHTGVKVVDDEEQEENRTA